MSTVKLLCLLLVVLAPLAGRCRGASSESYGFPPMLPVQVVVEVPDKTIYELMGNITPAEVGTILVLPVYKDYSLDEEVIPLAVAHVFACKPGEDLERQLAAAGQRDRLRRLVFWAHGYFPNSVGRVFRYTDTVGGHRSTLVEMQRCSDEKEAEQVDAAMRDLLQEQSFTIGWVEAEAQPDPPVTGMAPVLVTRSYDCAKLVRSIEFGSRYWCLGGPTKQYLLWPFGEGKTVRIVLSDAERRLIREFGAARRPQEDTFGVPTSAPIGRQFREEPP